MTSHCSPGVIYAMGGHCRKSQVAFYATMGILTLDRFEKLDLNFQNEKLEHPMFKKYRKYRTLGCRKTTHSHSHNVMLYIYRKDDQRLLVRIKKTALYKIIQKRAVNV